MEVGKYSTMLFLFLITLSADLKASFIEKNIIIPYLVIGQSYYEDQKYDSALLAYQIPALLLNITNPYQSSKEIKNHLTQNNFKGYIFWINLRLGQVYYYLGRIEESKKVLEGIINTNNNSEIANDLDNDLSYILGLVYYKSYEYEKSLSYLYNSLRMFQEQGGQQSYFIGLIYCDIGNVFYSISQLEKALEYYNIAQDILKNQNKPNLSKLSIIENNIGSIYYRKKDYKSAIYYYKSAIEKLEANDDDFYNLSMYYNNLAGLYLIMNKYEEAEELYLKSLKLRNQYLQNTILLVQSYNQIGNLYLLKKDYNKSLHFLQKAQRLNSITFENKTNSLDPTIYAVKDYWLMGMTLYQQAIVYNELANCDDPISNVYKKISYNTFKLVLNYFDHYYTTLISESNYWNFITFNREVLNTFIDSYYNSVFFCENEFLSLIERGKSIRLHQTLLDSKAKEFNNIPQELIAKEKAIKSQVDDISHQISMALEQNIDIDNPKEFANIIEERNLKIQQLDSLIDYYQNSYPGYYELKLSSQSYTIENIQINLSEKEAIIEYFVSDTMLYSLLITKNKTKVHCQKNDFLPSLTKKHLQNIKFTNYLATIQSGQALYNNLLSHFSNELSEISKLVIIPDADLSSFPFETLIKTPLNYNNTPYYLIYDIEISYHFSTSLLFKVSQKKETANSKLLSMAPVFDMDYYINKIDNYYISELPYSETEVKSIESIFNNIGYETNTIMGINATKEALLQNAKDYNVIHIATHGIYNESRPDESGLVLFTENDRRKKNPDENFSNLTMLYVYETFNLSLNADLVVLSSCMSGNGKFIKGEGLMTFYRGFFYSGAKNILFTRWSASDKYTYLFMTSFYKYFIDGFSYSKSMQLAKIDFLSDVETNLPKFWGNYLLLGFN